MLVGKGIRNFLFSTNDCLPNGEWIFLPTLFNFFGKPLPFSLSPILNKGAYCRNCLHPHLILEKFCFPGKSQKLFSFVKIAKNMFGIHVHLKLA